MNKTLLAVLILSLWIGGCAANTRNPAPEYKVTISRTTYGVAHIVANDYPSLGFGEGYAAAEDHVCNIAHGIVVARGERSKYHGMGNKKQHFMSDVVIRALDIPGRARDAFEQQNEEFKAWFTAYADGYNHYLKSTGIDNVGSWCAGQPWLVPISGADLFTRALALANTAPRVAGMIVSAKPPEQSQQIADMTFDLADELEQLQGRYLGSNAWAFGKERTETGRGLLLGNPHYPWSGTNRFWEKHLTIPGRLDAYGVHLIGGPGISIGFNKDVGWSHTVSDSERTVLYKLKLVPGKPTTYLYDGQPRSMTARQVDVEVKGKSEPVGHTVWFSHYGPIVQLPGVEWNSAFVLSMKDANLNNYQLFSQWKQMAEASSMDELIDAHRQWNAMPWVNTMATSADGRAVYIDGSNVGHLSPQAIQLWKQSIKTQGLAKTLYDKQKLVVLDGSDSRFEWQPHPESVIVGNVPFSEKPFQDRFDYIFNANDSYWLTNIKQPMAEHSPLYGPHGSARRLRTRMNAILVDDANLAGYAGDDGKFSIKEMQSAIFGNDSLAARLLAKELATACFDQHQVTIEQQPVRLAEACDIIANYNGKLDLDSRGSVLFREWLTQYPYSAQFGAGDMFSVPFDINDPVNTPNTLADKPLALERLGKAVQRLQLAGIALDASLGEAQFAYRGKFKIPVHGGKEIEGVANIIEQRVYDTQVEQVRGKAINGSPYLKDKGYPITFGTSFIYSLSYTEQGPVAEALLTYSQSGDPNSAHYADQTWLFSNKQWRPILFRAEDVRANTSRKITLSVPLVGSNQ